MSSDLEHKKNDLDLLEEAYPADNRYQIQRFTSFLQDKNLNLSPDNLMQYVDYLDAEYSSGKLAASTHATYISAVCSSLTTIADQLNLSDSERLAFEQVKKKANSRKKKVNSKAVDPDEIPTVEEFRELIQATKDRTIALLVEFLLCTGARISETLNIRLSDVSQKPKYADITLRGKESKERKIKVEKGLRRMVGRITAALGIYAIESLDNIMDAVDRDV